MSVLAAPSPTIHANGRTTAPESVRDFYRFTCDQYHQMLESGVLREDDPVELLEGLLVKKMAHKPPHASTTQTVTRVLYRVLPLEGWDLRIQLPISTEESEPEPDVAVVRGRGVDYKDHHPRPADIAIVMEIADSSVEDDRERKGRIYARAAIPFYWLINLVEKQVELYTDPTGPDADPRYRQREDFKPPAAVPFVLAGVEVARIPAVELLP